MTPEALKRRDDLDEVRSVPVVMADGQTWLLPKPWVAVHPVFKDGRPVDDWKCLTYGPELDALVENVAEAEGIASVLAGVALAAHLLRRNYDLSDDELAEVLVYRCGDPASQAMLRTVFDVATGRTGPKP